MTPLLLSLPLLAFDEAAIRARLAETAGLRSQRLYQDAPEIPASAYSEAAADKVATGLADAPGSAPPKAWGVGVMEVGIDVLWAALNDELGLPGVTPLSFAAVVRGTPCADDRVALMVMRVPVVADRWMVNHTRFNQGVARATGGAVRELAWAAVTDLAESEVPEEARPLIEGAVRVTMNSGAWWLVALDAGHTLTEYTSWSDPGGSVPAGPAAHFAAGSIEQTFEAMEGYARTGRSPCR